MAFTLLRSSTGSLLSIFASVATATKCGSFGCSSGSPVSARHTSSFGIGAYLNPSTISRSQGDRCFSWSSNFGSCSPRSSCISTQRRDEVTSTSLAPAWRWRYESLPGWSTSNVWCACLISDTRRPRRDKIGISFSINVVLPLPDQPAKPIVFIGLRRGYAAAGAAGAGRAPEAVRVEADRPRERPLEREIEDRQRAAGPVDRVHPEHLVEVAIVDPAVVANADQGAAHHAGGGSRIERRKQPFHVRLVLAGLVQVQAKPVDRHVGDRIEAV